jgi:aminopeptidase N
MELRLHERCACHSTLGERREWLAGQGLAARPFALAGTKRVYERARPFRIGHLALDLTLVVDEKRLVGVASLELERVDADAKAVKLDAVNFDIQGVTLVRDAREERLSFAYDGETLEVPLPRDLTQGRLVVRYSTKPVRGMYFLSPDEHVRDRPRQVWTQCQDEDARHVFPCHDKPHVKQTTEVRVSAPAGLDGALERRAHVEAEAEAGNVFHWKMTSHTRATCSRSWRASSRVLRTRSTACRSRTSCRRARGGRQAHVRAHARR